MAERTAGAHVTTALAEEAADIADRAVHVVGGGIHEDGHATGCIPFVSDLVVIGFLTPGGLLDRAVHIVLGHVHTTGILDRHFQARVGIRIGSPTLHSHGDLLADAGEELAQLGVACKDLVLAFLEDSAHGTVVRKVTAGDDGAVKIGRRVRTAPNVKPQVADIRRCAPAASRSNPS